MERRFRTPAHKYIALESASWISPEIRLYVIKEFQNAKLIEQGLGKKESLILLNKEANRKKELFNKNKEKAIYRLENK